MKNGTGNKRNRYRRILKKLPQLYECSQQIYQEAYLERGRAGTCTGREQKVRQDEKAWTAAFCYVLAPVLLSYVLWVLEDALESGKRRLYFLARDGYMMYLAAKYFCDERQLPIECRYLYCSRYALRSGEYRLLGEESLDYICLGGMKVTLEKMMRRGGLNREEAFAAGYHMGWEHKMHKPLSYEQVKALRPQLRENPFFMDRMLAHSEERYSHVLGYLKQEGMLENIPYAIVDSGWTGSIQRSIGRLLKSAGYRNRIEGYYFGLYEYVKDVEPELYHTWYFSPKSKNGRKAFFCNNLFECIFSSPEGMTRGYKQKEGKFVPVFVAEENPNRKRIETGASLLLRYAQYYNARLKKENSEKTKRVLAKLLASFMGAPARAEARVFGRYVFDDDVTGDEKCTIAHAFTEKEVQESRILRRLIRYVLGKEHPALQSAWPEACMVLSDAAGCADLFQTVMYKYMLYSKKSLEQRLKSRKRVKDFSNLSLCKFVSALHSQT